MTEHFEKWMAENIGMSMNDNIPLRFRALATFRNVVELPQRHIIRCMKIENVKSLKE